MVDRLVKSVVSIVDADWLALLAVGVAGGIHLAWNSVVLKVLDARMCSFSISIELEDLFLGVVWLFTRVYGSSVPKNRSEFWDEPFEIRRPWVGPCVVGGDFNVIRFANEKSPINRTIRSMLDFGAFNHHLSLCDCPLANGRFTWTTGQEIPILSRLDRFLV